MFDEGDPNVVGMTGLIGLPSGYHAVHDCDVLVMLGTNFPYDNFIPDGMTSFKSIRTWRTSAGARR
ncbi:MAG TPA: hypothetical protein VFN37_07520 [Candidatus Baltobacteraceae bacterium]|nr:hypothetical protein [Candidatus Baltobacteraceae bacterium]